MHVVHSDLMPAIPGCITWGLGDVEIVQIMTKLKVFKAVEHDQVSFAGIWYSIPRNVYGCLILA